MDDLGQAGATIAGCRLGTVIGTGGSSRVWLAVDRANSCRVAVKVLRGPLPVGERLRVRHPHLIAVQRVSENPPAVIMDFAEGGSLAAVVAARGPLDAGEVVTVLVGLAGALADLHRVGVVHGDVTGTNVLFTGEGRPVFADLGALRVAGAGPVVATAGYAAPEVLTGAPGGGAADVHGLCAVAWLGLTGAAPAAASSRAPLSVLAPRAPAALVDVISRGLDPDPRRRPLPEEVVQIAVGACRAEPVRLVGDAMPALPAPEAVTHRLREWSAEASAACLPDQGHGAVPERAGWWHGRRWRRAGVMVVAGATLGIAVAGVGVLTREYDARAAGAAGPVTSGPAISGPTASAPATGSEPASGVVAGSTAAGPGGSAHPEDVAALTRDLVQARTAALRSGDSGALDAVYAAGSPAAAADRQLIDATGGVDVAVNIAAVDPVDPVDLGSGTATVVVRMATEMKPPAAGGPRPDSAAAAADAATGAVRMDLVLTSGGWRILDVGPAGTGP